LTRRIRPIKFLEIVRICSPFWTNHYFEIDVAIVNSAASLSFLYKRSKIIKKKSRVIFSGQNVRNSYKLVKKRLGTCFLFFMTQNPSILFSEIKTEIDALIFLRVFQPTHLLGIVFSLYTLFYCYVQTIAVFLKL